jgi:hypothetical protein
MENAINLDIDTFAGLATCDRKTLLQQLFTAWRVQVQIGHEEMLKGLHTTDEGTRNVAQIEQEYRETRAKSYQDMMMIALTFNNKGFYCKERMEDASASLALTADELKTECQQEFFRKMEEKKEEALKAEYMAGFEAWKATQAGA